MFMHNISSQIVYAGKHPLSSLIGGYYIALKADKG